MVREATTEGRNGEGWETGEGTGGGGAEEERKAVVVALSSVAACMSQRWYGWAVGADSRRTGGLECA